MEKIIFAVADGDDFAHASQHVKQAYLEKFGTNPDDPHVYIVAKKGSTIIGTAGIDLPDKEGLLPIYRMREFYGKTRTLLTPENCAQFGRWSADDHSISLPLVYAVSLYAKKFHNKTYALIEQTESTNRILRQKGIAFLPLEYGELSHDNIPPNDLAFYQRFFPKPYLMELSQVLQALSSLPLSDTRIAFQ